jgi:hypothetical protein
MIDRRIGKIKLRRGTDLQRKNVILEEGEFVYTFDKQRLFIGDGQTVGGILVSSRNFITNAYGIPQKAEYGDIVHDQSAGRTYIVGRDNSNNLTLILIADADCCRKLQLRVDDLMTRLRALSSCLLPDEGTGTIDEGDDGTGLIIDQPPIIDNISTIAWAINISSPRPVVLGQSLTFTASAVGVGNITYKWNKIGVGDLPGKTLNYLTIGSITDADLGSYRCIATSDVAGSIISNTATVIKAGVPLTWVIQPTAPATIAYGTNFTATASAIGDGTITYRWYKDGVGYLISQATNVLTLNNVQVSDLGTYSCVARSTNTQTATSYSITLDVTTVGLHWVAGNWGDITNNYGDTVTMSASAAGDGVISYEWRKDVYGSNTLIVGENMSTYKITTLTQADTGTYAAVAKSTLGGSITSYTFHIFMNPPAVDVLLDGNYLISDPSGNYILDEEGTYIKWE